MENKLDTLVGLLAVIMIIVTLVQGCKNRKSLERIESVIAPIEIVDTNVVEVTEEGE